MRYTTSQMAAAIRAIPQTELLELEALANGTYTAPSGKAYNEVTVDVDDPDALEVEALTAEHNGLYVPESGHAYSSARVHVTTRVTGTGDLMIFVTAPTGCAVTAEKLDGDDEGALYTGVESQQTAGEYTIKVMGYGEYEVAISKGDFSISKTVAVELPAVNLPIGDYDILEYLESTGTQYINTGITFTSGFRVVCKFEYTSNESAGRVIIGADQGGGPWCSLYLSDAFNPGMDVGRKNSIIADYQMLINHKYQIDASTIGPLYSDAYIMIDGVRLTLGNESDMDSIPNYPNRPLYLFGDNHSSGNPYCVAGRIYGDVKLYDDQGNLAAQFIPVNRKSDDAVGMYDIVRNQFFTNAGTGTFIAGPELT